MDDLPGMSNVRERVLELSRQRGDIAAAYLLGSAVRGRLRPDSDVDLALLPMGERPIPLQARLALAGELERDLGRSVDVGVITRANLIYAAEAILKGRQVVRGILRRPRPQNHALTFVRAVKSAVESAALSISTLGTP